MNSGPREWDAETYDAISAPQFRWGTEVLARLDLDGDETVLDAGCGSSREHAPWALEDFGFEAIVAPSFADIFYVNCTKIGLLPAVLDEEHCRAVADAGEARIDVDDQTIECAAGVFEFQIEPDVQHRLLKGLDDIGITLENGSAIDAFEGSGGAERGPVTTALR